MEEVVISVLIGGKWTNLDDIDPFNFSTVIHTFLFQCPQSFLNQKLPNIQSKFLEIENLPQKWQIFGSILSSEYSCITVPPVCAHGGPQTSLVNGDVY